MRNISLRTQEEMYLFFLKTSAPRIAARIVAEEKNKEKEMEENDIMEIGG